MAKTTRESLRALFSKAQKEEQTKSVKGYTDDRFLKFKIGNTYSLRLLYCPVGDRTSPFIEQKVHRNYNPNLRKYTKVVCASSPYLQGYEGYKSCPVCQAAAKFYAKKEAGDKNAATMYDTAKSITENYAVVYVVSDSTKDETNCEGQIKIIKYGYDIQKVLDMYVMGKEVKGAPALPEDEIIGFEAFDLEKGRNLIISVAEKRVGQVKFPNYTASFSNKYSSVPLTEDEVAEAFEKLHFDRDFYVQSDPNAINSFYKEFILKNTGSLDIEEEDEGELVDDDDDADEVFNQPVEKNSSKSVEVEKDDKEDDLNFDDDDDEEEIVPKKSKKPSFDFDEEDDDEDDDFDDEDEEEIPVKKSKKSKPVIEDDDNFDDEDEPVVKKTKTASKKSKVVFDDEEDDIPMPKKAKSKPSKVDDDDDWNMDFDD